MLVIVFTEGKPVRGIISRGNGKVPPFFFFLIKKKDDVHLENDPQRELLVLKKTSLVKLHAKNNHKKHLFH